MSLGQDSSRKPGKLRPLGWEDPEAEKLSSDQVAYDILWEHWSPQQQVDEIEQAWPGTGYVPH